MTLTEEKIREASAMKVGGRYNWKNQPERLIYTGLGIGGSRGWHQFELVSRPGKVWCEVLTQDLHMLEETALPEVTP